MCGYDKRLKLCYVENNIAYFTTQPLSKQWGDDWDDAPYEHNAGAPYEPCWHNRKDSGIYPCECDLCKREWNKDGTPKWVIEKIMFDAEVRLPNYGVANSDYSVQDINKKKIAWIRSLYHKNKSIYAGVNVTEFIEAIEGMGGECYGRIKVYHFKFPE